MPAAWPGGLPGLDLSLLSCLGAGLLPLPHLPFSHLLLRPVQYRGSESLKLQRL